jgi:hypothetical protein
MVQLGNQEDFSNPMGIFAEDSEDSSKSLEQGQKLSCFGITGQY